MKKYLSSNRRGQLILTAIFVLAVVALLVLVVASQLAGESVSTAKNYQGIQALNIAEGGVRFIIETSLATDSDWSDKTGFLAPVALNPGTFTVHYLYGSPTICSLEVKGTVGGVSRTVRAGFKKKESGLQGTADKYAIYMSGGHGAVIGNNSRVNGSAFISGNLIMGSGTVVTEDAFATGTIIGGSVLGLRETYVPPPSNPPSLETSYYDAEIYTAQTNPTYTGNRTFSGSLPPGAYYVKGNVTLDNLTLTGVTTIVATGTVIAGNNKTIGDLLAITAAGSIIIGNNSNIGNYGLWYSSTNIIIGNSGDIADITAGTGTAFVTPGNIIAGNTCAFNGFMYAGGSLTMGNNLSLNGLIVSRQITIGNNANVSRNPLIMNFDDIPGMSGELGGTILPGGITIIDWREVY